MALTWMQPETRLALLPPVGAYITLRLPGDNDLHHYTDTGDLERAFQDAQPGRVVATSASLIAAGVPPDDDHNEVFGGWDLSHDADFYLPQDECGLFVTFDEKHLFLIWDTEFTVVSAPADAATDDNVALAS